MSRNEILTKQYGCVVWCNIETTCINNSFSRSHEERVRYNR